VATAQELVSASNCLDCGISDGQKLSVLIYLFGQVAGVSMTAQELVAASACYNCGISPGQQMAVLIYLAGQIAEGGGGGGAPQGVFCGNYSGGTPSPTPIASCAIAIDTSNGTLWHWYSGAWH
jgi:hypothetical protein